MTLCPCTKAQTAFVMWRAVKLIAYGMCESFLCGEKIIRTMEVDRIGSFPGLSGVPSLPGRILLTHPTVSICSGYTFRSTGLYCSAKQVSMILIFIF